MGASVGAGDGKKSLDVELNIVPFIDLMSCLTAFLLVTAVWVNIAQLEIRPAGHARDVPPCIEVDCDPPRLSVLIEADDIWVGVSRVNDFQKLEKTPFAVLRVDVDGVALAELALQQPQRERVLDQPLDRALERAGAVGRVPACLGEDFLRRIRQLEPQAALG